MSIGYTVEQAEAAVKHALDGRLGLDGQILVDLFKRASGRKAERDAQRSYAEVEREANALAAIVADLLEDARGRRDLTAFIDKWVDDLPHDARRRVLAYRHKGGRRPFDNHFLSGVGARDQFGRLPTVPPRDSVMRDRVRTVDAEAWDTPVSDPSREIEGRIVEVVDELLPD